MKRNDEKFHEDRRVGGLPVQSEKIAFEPAELVVCPVCGRANPPTKVKCFYCAAELPLKAGYLPSPQSLNLRKLENWEKGFNLICLPSGPPPVDCGEPARMLDLPIEIAGRILSAQKPLPILRAETFRETEIVAENLRRLGIETKIISDESLMPEILPHRLRGINFREDVLELILFNTGETVRIRRDQLALIVTGAVFERKTESIEKRQKGEVKILESSEFASDEILMDIYSRSHGLGYRVLTKGFDYSGLGAEKGLLAIENLKKLEKKLLEFAPAAKLIDDYLQLREIIGSVWEVDNRRDAKGLKRHSYNKFDFANVESSSNLQQFTKYSRLQRQLI